MRSTTKLLLATLVALVLAAPAAAQGASFSTPVKLLGATGGEPSIAADPFGDVYVDGPQGIPSGANGESGIGFWLSRNNGASFGKAKILGSFLGGGDSDVIFSRGSQIDRKGAVYISDLEGAAAAICKSTDRGKTFDSIGPFPDPNHCTKVGAGQAGPSDDRQWLTADSKGTLYLTYHEFVTAQPIAYRSNNGGKDDFATPCGPLITDPAIEANVPTDVTGGTLVARPVTDKAGNFYVLIVSTTQAQNVAAQSAGQPSGTFSQIYLAVSHDHCQTFKDFTVFDGSKLGTNTVQFGDIFNDLAIDGAGNMYVIGTGFVGRKKAFANTTNVYLFTSQDHGKKWRGPRLLGSTNAAHMLPAAVGGPLRGELAVGFFRTVNGVTDPNSVKGKWTYSTAETNNALAAHPSFVYRDVNPGYIYHKGEICNLGILCGLVPGGPSDRSLLDFTSVVLGRGFCPIFTFAGNPKGVAAGTWNYVTRQTQGCFASGDPDHDSYRDYPGGER